MGISSIVVNPSNPNILFAATGDGELWYTNSAGILKSTDGGATWNTTGLNWNVADGKIIRKLIMNPNSQDVMIAATTAGMYKTSDGGISWTNNQTGNFYDVEFKPGDPSHVYATTYDYWGGNTDIFTSTDGGDSWISVQSFSGTVIKINLAVTPTAPDQVDALCAEISSRALHSIWRSNNSGASYTQILQGTCFNNYLSHNYPLGSSSCEGQGEYDLVLAKSPTNAGETWIGGVNSWKTTDNGNTWAIKNFWYSGNGLPVVHADKHSISYNPLNNKIYECNDGGLSVTSNGGTSWTNLSNGLGITQIYRIGTSATLPDNVLCGTQDNSTKQLKNGSWIETLNTGDGIECIIDFTNPSIQYGMRINGDLRKSINGGNTWGNSLVTATGSGVNGPGD